MLTKTKKSLKSCSEVANLFVFPLIKMCYNPAITNKFG